MPVELTRRGALGLGLALTAGAAIGRPVLATARAVRRSSADPVSMAMHLHASFSEGRGSMAAQLDNADRLGIDVLWWTEHDFRMAAHGYREAVRFDALTELEDGDPWTWAPDRSGPLAAASGDFVTDQTSPDESGAALRLTATGPGDAWGALTYAGTAWNSTATTNISDTTLEIDALAESLGPDAELVIGIGLSFHPASGGRAAGTYALEYRIGTGGPRTTEGTGLLGVVPRRLDPGWQRLHLQPVEDVAALWPDLVAGDHALTALTVGVRARHGATAQAVVDRLRFRRTGRDDAPALQAELVRQYARRYPGVLQKQAVELSLTRHVNAFGGRTLLPPMAPGAHKDDSLAAVLDMVAWAQRQRGSLVSHNHPLDGPVGSAAELAGVLVATRNLGADLIEIGTPQDVEALSWAYDVAARNSLFVTATGVSDDHTGRSWESRKARWITSVWAPSTGEGALLGALDAGRAYFWDLAGWAGTLDLQVQGRPAMGGVLVTQDASTPVDVTVSDLPAGGSLEVVVGRVDNAGAADLTPAVDRTRTPTRALTTSGRTVALTPGSYLRAAVRSADGTLVGFSNPVWVLGAEPATGIPAGRRL